MQGTVALFRNLEDVNKAFPHLKSSIIVEDIVGQGLTNLAAITSIFSKCWVQSLMTVKSSRNCSNQVRKAH